MLRLTVPVGSKNMGVVSPLGHGENGGEKFISPLAPNAQGTMADKWVHGTNALLYELSSPLSLASFASGVFLGRVATASFLASSTSWGWGTALGSQVIGLGTEIATITLGGRLGAQVFYGAQDQFNPREIAHEILLMAGPLAMLRVSHRAFAQLAPALETGVSKELRRVLTPAVQLSSDVLAVMGGHYFNQSIKLAEPLDGASLFYSGLLNVVQMRAAGQILSPFTSGSLDQVIQFHEQRLRSSLIRPSGDINSSDDFSSPALGHLGPSTGGKASREAWDSKLRIISDEEKTPTSPRVADSEPPPSSERGAMIHEEIKTRFVELQKEAEVSSTDTLMLRAAKRLQALYERYRSNPDGIADQSFRNGLSAVKEDLNQAEANGKKLRNGLRRFLAFLDQVSNPSDPAQSKSSATTTPIAGKPPPIVDDSPVPLRQVLLGVLDLLRLGRREGIKKLWERVRKPELDSAEASPLPIPEVSPEVQADIDAVRAQAELKLKQGTQVDQALRTMDGVRRYLSMASKRGLAEDALSNMNARLLRLRNYFPNFKWETISWTHDAGQAALRRNGTLVGLVMRTPNMKLDTTLARRLRGESIREAEDIELDRDLEVLQLSLMLGAGWRGSIKKMNRVMDRLIEEYAIQYRSADAARLAAEATYKTVIGEIPSGEMLDYLGSKSKGGSLEGALISLKGAVTSKLDLPNSMFSFTQEGSVENYFLSSLGVVLRSSGETKQFIEGLKKMDEASRAGFHPSVALGLFGAIHGQGNLPKEFLPSDFNDDLFLTRAQNEFLSTTSDVVNSGGE